MPGAEGLDGGSPEIRAFPDQAPVSQGYDPDAAPDFEERVDDVMHRSGQRLTRSEAEDYIRQVDGKVNLVEQEILKLQKEQGEAEG